jgi:hypothetical protein
MSKPNLIAASAGALLIGGMAQADDAARIVIPAETRYAENAQVPPAVRNECKLETRLASWIKTYADEIELPVKVAEGDPAKGAGRVLDVKITQVLGAGGGAWSGAKSVQVMGELREGDTVVAAFGGSRVSGGGAFSGFKSTCAIMGHCVKALGRDIARWLKNPAPNARLGDG